jgi:hypothetical protein
LRRRGALFDRADTQQTFYGAFVILASASLPPGVIHQGAAEFSREFLRDFTASEKPKHIILIFVPLAGKSHMNTALFVKGDHCIEPLSEGAPSHRNFHAQRKLAGLPATSAFVPSPHPSILMVIK